MMTYYTEKANKPKKAYVRSSYLAFIPDQFFSGNVFSRLFKRLRGN